MKLTVIIPRKIEMRVSPGYTFPSLCFYSNGKSEPVNFEQPEKQARIENSIFTHLWLHSALGKFKHLAILAKVLSIQLPSKRSSPQSTVPPHTSFCWLKKAELQVTHFYFFVQALVSDYSCAIIRSPRSIFQVLLRFPAGCQLLASSESLKAVHLFPD